MAKSKKKKQERLSAKRSRKASRRKTASVHRKQQQSIHHSMPVASLPIHETLIADTLVSMGQSIAIFSRLFPDGRVALAFFLVDVYCMGVKDADYSVVSMEEYQDFLVKTEQHGRLIEIEPECQVKLIHESVEYAGELGFAPHKDYRKAKKIFGAVTGDDCDRTFEFGKDGKPLYVASPNDSPARIARIMGQLERAVGEDGFHFIHPLDEDDFIL